MQVETPKSEALVDWRKVHALGLPSGSIRALLAILIFATVWGLLLIQPSEEVPEYLSGLLFIIMGHYFAARRRAPEAEEPGPPPLFLPRGSVRFLLLGGSVAVAVVLFEHGQMTSLDQNRGVVTLLLVGGFLLGVALNTLTAWWKDRGHQPPRIIEDVRAMVSLAAGGILVFLVVNRIFLIVPPTEIDAILQTLGPCRAFRPGAYPCGVRRVLLRLAILNDPIQQRNLEVSPGLSSAGPLGRGKRAGPAGAA